MLRQQLPTSIAILDFNRTLYDPESNKLIDGARDLLDSLKSLNLKLYLISRKETGRASLFSSLKIDHYFQEIILTEEKTIDQFKKILSRQETDLSKSFVIGDRIKSEITLGNQLGLKTIWFRSGKFMTELPSQTKEHPWHTSTTLWDICQKIQQTLS